MLYDPLAQLVEHMTFNHGVRRSNRRWVTCENLRNNNVSEVFACKNSYRMYTKCIPNVLSVLHAIYFIYKSVH